MNDQKRIPCDDTVYVGWSLALRPIRRMNIYSLQRKDSEWNFIFTWWRHMLAHCLLTIMIH